MELDEEDPELAQCLRPFPMSPMMQTDFLRQMDLINVSTLGLDDDLESKLGNNINTSLAFNWSAEQEIHINSMEGASKEERHVDTHHHKQKSNTPNEDVQCDEALQCDEVCDVQRVLGERLVQGEVRVDALRTCGGCQSRVRCSQFGKHLISHFHHHKTRNASISQQLVLNNIDAIVRLAPFQCSACRFYANWQHDFLLHWKSKEHRTQCESLEREGARCRVFWCDFCHVYESSSDAMLTHLESARHNEIVEALGRCVPMVIRRVSLFACDSCPKSFRLYRALQRHRQRHHSLDTLLDESKVNGDCSSLRSRNHREESVEEPQRHVRDMTGGSELVADASAAVDDEFVNDGHICGICGVLFASAQHLGAHVKRGCRKAMTAIDNNNNNNNDDDNHGGYKFKCDECFFVCGTASTLLFHRSLVHQESDDDNNNLYTCVACYSNFSLKSRLWTHVLTHTNKMWKCDQCYKKFASRSRFSDHRSKCGHKEDNSKRSLTSSSIPLRCLQCPYTTTKARLLKLHVQRRHTAFSSFSCSDCPQSFCSASSLQKHRRLHHDQLHHMRRHRCPECNFSAHTASDLKSHMKRHSPQELLKCGKCPYVCRRRSELNRHQLRRHSSKRESSQLQCDQCDYRTLSRQHLKRHMAAMHDNDKTVYVCPMCDFTTGSMDNLRKHVTKTKRHAHEPFLYQCRLCPRDNGLRESAFVSNDVTHFQTHLSDLHSDSFEKATDVLDYVKSLFNLSNPFACK